MKTRQLAETFLVAWLLLATAACATEKQAGTPPAPKGDPVAGKRIFQEQCATCHTDRTDEVRIGASLKGLFAQKTLPSRGLPLTYENVRRAIEEGASPPGLPPMPAYRETLKPNEIDDLMAYLKTL